MSTLRAIHDSQSCTLKITNGLQTDVNFCQKARHNVSDAQDHVSQTGGRARRCICYGVQCVEIVSHSEHESQLLYTSSIPSARNDHIIVE